MIDYKEKLETLDVKLKEINKEYLETMKELGKTFNSKAKDYLNGGYKIIKIAETNTRYEIYGIVNDITFRIWNNGERIWSKSINADGLFFYKHNNNRNINITNITNNVISHADKIFTYFDRIEEITVEELNDVINKWYLSEEDEYLYPDNEGASEEDWIYPDTEWFRNDGYDRYFKDYKDIINNELINKEFKKYEQ